MTSMAGKPERAFTACSPHKYFKAHPSAASSPILQLPLPSLLATDPLLSQSLQRASFGTGYLKILTTVFFFPYPVHFWVTPCMLST